MGEPKRVSSGSGAGEVPTKARPLESSGASCFHRIYVAEYSHSRNRKRVREFQEALENLGALKAAYEAHDRNVPGPPR